ncbi:Cytochrome P450 76C4 [Morus notabilis]|uniref:Cytochrome P450 76C4 n=1 Tax=Morus notabilis TaxID=981085 RepID=W9S6N5_9ROSA|nr:geraniol 8-hydroxylase [Morus notabilis]EXC17810.1 Cytochrome P450 76C4 [Morus notabilis]
MDLLSVILLVILTWALIRTAHSITRPNPNISGKLPPGPKPLPVIGNLHQLGDKPHKSLSRLAQLHGPLMSLKLGQVTAIVVSSPAMAKEVLQTHDQHLSNRTIPDALHILGHQHTGLPWIPVSNHWRTLRKICNTQLFAVKVLDTNQELRRRKVRELFEGVRRSGSAGESVDIGSEAFTTTLNLLSNTIFSVDLADPKSELAREFKEVAWGIMKEAGTPNLGDYFPLLRKIDPQGIRRRMTVHFERILSLLDGMINQRLRVRESSGVVHGDVLDTLLNIIEEKTEDINRHQVLHFLLVLFVAGTDTTASTFQWAMAELLRNPEVLSKARAELNQIIGKGKQVEESDIARLPYLQAVVKETFRLHPVVPLLLPRRAETDVEIGGFKIPKGAQIMVNAWAIGRDSGTWEDPNEFKPERFLGSEIDVRGRSFELIPFGAGRRICPGLPLAIRMLHLMLGTLIHSFDWKLEDDKKDVDMDDKFGITLEMARPLRAVPSPAQG